VICDMTVNSQIRLKLFICLMDDGLYMKWNCSDEGNKRDYHDGSVIYKWVLVIISGAIE